MDPSQITIAHRFRGPTESGNGGFTCGSLARRLGRAPVEVTLRKPPPLDAPLRFSGDGVVALYDQDTLIAEARLADLSLPLPTPFSFDDATRMSRHFAGHDRHAFPECFVCGPARPPGDGLRIFPGTEQPGTPVAAPWIPERNLADDKGTLGTEVLWAALDCAGYWAASAPDHPVALLGRMTATLVGAVAVGEKCVVMGWALGREGRKLHAATALFDAQGRPRGWSRQIWIAV